MTVDLDVQARDSTSVSGIDYPAGDESARLKRQVISGCIRSGDRDGRGTGYGACPVVKLIKVVLTRSWIRDSPNVNYGIGELEALARDTHKFESRYLDRLIGRLFEVVAPGGSLIVQAQYLDVEGKSNRWPALLDLAMLCTTHGGRNHSVAETRRWMEEAGFRDVELTPLSMFNTNSFLTGLRP